MSSMFERYGGFATVSKLVMEFYDRALDSDILAPYFENTDMRRLIDHQTKFIAAVMGGPASYTNEILHQVHHHLNIDNEAFDEMVKVLEDVMVDFEMDDDDVVRIKMEIVQRRPYVVGGNGG